MDAGTFLPQAMSNPMTRQLILLQAQVFGRHRSTSTSTPSCATHDSTLDSPFNTLASTTSPAADDITPNHRCNHTRPAAARAGPEQQGPGAWAGG